MARYSFNYINIASVGGPVPDKPSHSVEATDDQDAYRQIEEFIKEEPGREYVPGTLFMSGNRRIADPPNARLSFDSEF